MGAAEEARAAARALDGNAAPDRAALKAAEAKLRAASKALPSLVGDAGAHAEALRAIADLSRALAKAYQKVLG